MPEHLSSDQRDTLLGTVQVLVAYFCEYATDGDLFTLHALLSQHAAQLAHRMASMGEGMLPPPQVYETGLGPRLTESLQRRLEEAQQNAVQRHS